MHKYIKYFYASAIQVIKVKQNKCFSQNGKSSGHGFIQGQRRGIHDIPAHRGGTPGPGNHPLLRQALHRNRAHRRHHRRPSAGLRQDLRHDFSKGSAAPDTGLGRLIPTTLVGFI